MSHFTVLVVADEPTEQSIERALAPFHEFECTGRDDEFVKDIDITERARSEFKQQVTESEKTFANFCSAWYGYEIAQDGEPLTDDHKYGYVLVNQDGNVLRVIKRTNPEAHYDWYRIGGRWGGFFTLKPGRTGISFHAEQLRQDLSFSKRFAASFGASEGNTHRQAELSTAITEAEAPRERQTADIAFKGDIDFDEMRNEAENEKLPRYNTVQALITHLPKFEHWKAIRERYGDDVDAAREAYHAQPAVKAFEGYSPFDHLEDYDMSPEVFAEKARRDAIPTFAVVKDGVWHQRARMGWFGHSSNEIDEDEWSKQYELLIDSLPDTAVLALVDCHI